MQKTRIDLDIVLPDVPDEKDACVRRIIAAMETKRGIEKVHIVPETDSSKAQFCFHYDPEQISIEQIENLAKQAGADITERYGHLLLEVKGIRHVRHARVIELGLEETKGILSASASAAGWIKLEYDHHTIEPEKIYKELNKEGINIVSPALVNVKHHDHEHDTHDDHKHEDDSDHDHAGHDHQHSHGGIFGEKTELIFAIVCGVFLATGFGLSFIDGMSSFVPLGCYIGAYLFGGFYTTKEAIEGISKGEFEIDFLMLVAAVGAAALGQWAEGSLLLFLFSLGHSLEHYAMAKAKKSIAALAALAPKTALLKKGNDVTEVKIEELKMGDIIVIRPNSKIAADGIVVNGNSSVNQAPITGESIPVDKTSIDANTDISKVDQLDAKYKVFAGSINGGQALEIKVSKVAADSTIARLVKMVNEAQTQKSATQNFTDKLEKYYVPAVLILIVLLLFAFLVIDETFSQSFYRAMAVLVAASPCALAISTPSAVLSGVARAARGGVLIKGGKPLEELGSLTAIAFDKTGTLTEGKPKLTGVYPLNGTSEEKLLSIIIAVEKLSDHPLAKAIVKGGIDKLKKDVAAVAKVEAINGRGVRSEYEGSVIHIGNKELFIEKSKQLPADIKTKTEELESTGNTTMIVQQNDQYIGIITLMDVARADAKETLAKLQKIGIRKMVMLTGDNQKVAEAIAKEIGITDAWGNLLPEQKVAAIDKLKASEKQVAMVGDGVNDAPAMAKSTVGIAMGAAGSDVALETADIALMADQLSNLPFAIGLSRKAHNIIKQNLIISLGMVVLLIPLTLFGYASMGPAVIGHEGSTIVVVFNALRLLAYKK
ncbi:MAG: heavy metal translocating P-type ATPase [Chitinophagaceae bacterium]